MSDEFLILATAEINNEITEIQNILNSCHDSLDISKNMVVYPQMIEKHIQEELPFIATENILMAAVKKGGDRQLLHERIRIHSIEAGKKVKEEGQSNDLIQRIIQDPLFNIELRVNLEKELKTILASENFIGFAVEQTTDFLSKEIRPLLKKYKDLIGDHQQMEL